MVREEPEEKGGADALMKWKSHVVVLFEVAVPCSCLLKYVRCVCIWTDPAMCTCARGRIRNCIVHARLVTDGSGYHFLCIYIDRIILVDMERRSVGVLSECGRVY